VGGHHFCGDFCGDFCCYFCGDFCDFLTVYDFWRGAHHYDFWYVCVL
jgi:hypothetical protein